MNPMLLQALQVAIGVGIGILIKHLWPASTPSPNPSPVVPSTPVVDPFKNFPGLPGHPLLNSPLTQLFLQQVEQALLSSLQGTASNMVSISSVTPKV